MTITFGRPSRLMSAEEVAKQFGLSVQTLANWRSTRRSPIPYIRVGARIRYRSDELEEFLKRQTVQADC